MTNHLPDLLPLLVSVALFLGYLVYERASHDRRIDSIPLRIAITGTRGKSSVARMLASVLRQEGRSVLAKTTGSQARYILPDGGEIEIPRRGMTSIIEQKEFVKKAADLKADCFVAEMMSIHPENHYIESHKLLRPNVVVVTNVLVDHTDAMGGTEEEVAAVYGLDIPEGARVFIPEAERRDTFEAAVERAGADLIGIPVGISRQPPGDGLELEKRGFPENLDLVRHVGRDLGISEMVIEQGIAGSRGDIGALRLWKYHPGSGSGEIVLVNGFAANDPGSTSRVISRLSEFLPAAFNRFFGLLSLRADRADRTLQWVDALRDGLMERFSGVYVMGAHSAAVGRRLEGVHVLRSTRPERVMDSITRGIGRGAVIVGMGNIVGAGMDMVEYWERTGEEYGL